MRRIRSENTVTSLKIDHHKCCLTLLEARPNWRPPHLRRATSIVGCNEAVLPPGSRRLTPVLCTWCLAAFSGPAPPPVSRLRPAPGADPAVENNFNSDHPCQDSAASRLHFPAPQSASSAPSDGLMGPNATAARPTFRAGFRPALNPTFFPFHLLPKSWTSVRTTRPFVLTTKAIIGVLGRPCLAEGDLG